MLDAVEELLRINNYKYIRIDGSSSTTQRKYLIDKFQIDSQYVCAVLSITSTNAGISLTAANQVVFAELHWNPSVCINCIYKYKYFSSYQLISD